MPANPPLISAVKAICSRLAPLGWDELFQRQGLDITAADLAAELGRKLPNVDRTQPGFGDFAMSGDRGIEPSRPSHSLLYHALCSPLAVGSALDGVETPLTGFPTPAELVTVLDYVFAARPTTIEDLRARAAGAPLAIVVFAYEYRAAVETVHRKHADLSFSRVGISRIGTRPPIYQDASRSYSPAVGDSPNDVAALPCRYGAFIAAALPGEPTGHGPMHFVAEDEKAGGKPLPEQTVHAYGRRRSDSDRRFWVPLHKLFDGEECIRDFDLHVDLEAHHINEKIRRVHLFFGAAGHDGGWHEPDISRTPFVFRQDIAEFARGGNAGAGLLVPSPHDRLVEPAEFGGEPLTYIVPESTKDNEHLWRPRASSLNLRAGPTQARQAAEYIHARHVIQRGGRERNLNHSAGVVEKVTAGGYRARHYLDFTGDGWIAAECGELALEVPTVKAAYSVVGPPDFFPLVRQSELVRWTDQAAPPELSERIWPSRSGRPEPLSAQRLAPNLTLKNAGFDPADDTMTAIVGFFGNGDDDQSPLRLPDPARVTNLSDAAAGVFAPGWDVSFDRTPEEPTGDGARDMAPGVDFLTNYGLGSPFLEDSMLCSALSSFWPAVVPDISRSFPPDPKYATETPLLDETIGIRGTPWDGIRPPRIPEGSDVIEFLSLDYGDYVEVGLGNGFNFQAVTGMTVMDYLARTVSMAHVWDAMELTDTVAKAKWSVLSFTREAEGADPSLSEWLAGAGRSLQWQWAFRFEMIRHDGITRKHRLSRRFDTRVADILERRVYCADPRMVVQFIDGAWKATDDDD